MAMMLFAQACATGITNGLIYALIGLGMAVIFKGSRLINAMHGELAVVGAASAVYCVEIAMLPTWLAVTIGMMVSMILSTLVDIGLVRRLFSRNAREESFLLLTVGLGFTFSAAVLYVFGREEHLLPAFGDEIYEVAGAIVREQTIWIVVISAFILVGLKLFYKYTDFGLAMMAASTDPDGAATIGINVRLMRTATFALGGLMAAVAGLLITPMIGVSYQMGPILTLKGFAAAVLGGLTNPLGAVVGGITIGLLESLSIVYISSGLKDAVALSVLIVIMILVPDGILGKTGRKGG